MKKQQVARVTYHRLRGDTKTRITITIKPEQWEILEQYDGIDLHIDRIEILSDISELIL